MRAMPRRTERRTEQGYTLQTLITMAILVLLAVGVGAIIVVLVRSNSENISQNNIDTGLNPCNEVEIHDADLARSKTRGSNGQANPTINDFDPEVPNRSHLEEHYRQVYIGPATNARTWTHALKPQGSAPGCLPVCFLKYDEGSNAYDATAGQEFTISASDIDFSRSKYNTLPESSNDVTMGHMNDNLFRTTDELFTIREKNPNGTREMTGVADHENYYGFTEGIAGVRVNEDKNGCEAYDTQGEIVQPANPA